MLAKLPARSGQSFQGHRFAIVAANYNALYVDALVEAAEREFKAVGDQPPKVIRVPGSFEIPVVAAILARQIPPYAAILCFGAILKGATTHADHIALGVTHALASIQITTGIPIIHGVLQFDNEEQAKVRCLGTEHNRGTEAARVALSMAEVMKSLSANARP
jgi:6,7-dimethyl-8-ribityllumazine synthase